MRASVHWNLHRGGYSIKYPGEPMQYADSVTMTDCEFVIVPSLRKKFEENPNRRTVHALIRGNVVAVNNDNSTGFGEFVRCNPFQFKCFVRADGAKAVTADLVHLRYDKRIEAIGLQVDASVDTQCHIVR